MTTLNDIIRRRTANKYAGTKLGTQIANEYETGSRAAQNLNPKNQRGQKRQKVGVKLGSPCSGSDYYCGYSY
jgi:hypothetical protein